MIDKFIHRKALEAGLHNFMVMLFFFYKEAGFYATLLLEVYFFLTLKCRQIVCSTVQTIETFLPTLGCSASMVWVNLKNFSESDLHSS